jgi:hypothetical protein
MAKKKIGSNVRVTPDDDLVLITKLKKIAPYTHLAVNTLAKKFLHEKCDEYLKQNNIDSNSVQPTACVG